MRRKLYRVIDLDGEYIITDAEIIRTYFPWWCSQMRKANVGYLISAERCIEDFCVGHWTLEIKHD